LNIHQQKNTFSTNLASHVGLFIATTIWASTFINIKVALLQVQPNTLAFLRFFLASIVLGLLCLVKKETLVARKDWPGVAACGLTGVALYNFFQTQGRKHSV